MIASKQLWLLVGANGAGKSTFYQTRLAPLGLSFVNADVIAKALYPEATEMHSYEAVQLAEGLRYRLLQEGRSFCFETVFSHPSKIDFVARAKSLGYQIILVFIHLDSATLNFARVAQRIEEGGHSVPEDKIESRIPRLLNNVNRVLPLCDEVQILDNSRWDDPFRRVVSIYNGKVEKHMDPLPAWMVKVLDV